MQFKKLNLFPLYAVIFVAFLGYSMMIAIFTSLASQGSFKITGDLRQFWLGFLLALYPLGQCLGRPFILKLANYYGKNRVYFISLIFTAIGYVCIGTSIDKNFIALSVSVFFTGLSESNITIAAQTVTHVSLSLKRPELISRIEGSIACAFFAGPLLSAWKAPINPSRPFFIVAGILIVICVSFVIRRLFSRLPEISIKMNDVSPFKTWQLGYIAPFILNFALYFSIFGFFRAYPLHLDYYFNMDIRTLSLSITGVSVPIILVTFLVTHRLVKRFSEHKVAATGALIIGVFMLLLPLIKTFGILLWICLILIGAGIGLCLPVAPMLIAKVVRRWEREPVTENDESWVLISEAISSFVGGILGFILLDLPLFVFAGFALFAFSCLLIKIMKT
ncbi:MAG: MFS transporter [Chlamydiae bacterium]|nr:MFS transporter [Chlamydiota bacterium]